jgi:hypothetical protein
MAIAADKEELTRTESQEGGTVRGEERRRDYASAKGTFDE